jgi:hypothetical protein
VGKKQESNAEMKRKSALSATEWLDNRPEPTKDLIEFNIELIKSSFSKEAEKLNLSPKLLFYLMHYNIVFTSMEQVNGAFNERLDNFSYGKMEQFMRRRDRKMVWITIPPSSLYKKHQKILFEAVTYIHQHCPWKLRNWLPDRFKEFRAISEKIIRNTDPKEIKWRVLSQKQKEWIQHPFEGIGWRGPIPIKDLFDHMVYGYVAMVDQLSKYRRMNLWLAKEYVNLHDFYLLGGRRYAKERVFPSIKERLKTLDRLVNYTDDLVILETAIKPLKCLIDNDLLFTSVFYSYLYKPERGKLPDLKRKALEKVKPLIYLLRFFDIQPIDYNSIKIKSIYDFGVLLLNALAG